MAASSMPHFQQVEPGNYSLKNEDILGGMSIPEQLS